MQLFHIESLTPLYEDVQQSGIFPDSKFFPDCLPLGVPETILSDYLKLKNDDRFDLRQFVESHFNFPEEPKNDYHSSGKSLDEHLQALWPFLTRAGGSVGLGTLISLPHPYIVPGGRFREVYYWDSYFTMLGLRVSGQNAVMGSMIDNFDWLIQQIGFIPNGNRSYYLGRSQPPFFALMVDLYCDGDSGAMLRYLPALEKEYDFWMADGESRRVVAMPNGALLNRYWDAKDTPRPEAWVEDVHHAAASGRTQGPFYRHIRAAAESGWDFSSRWFADGASFVTIQTTDIVPVDLNCLLYFLEKTLSNLCIADREKATFYSEQAAARKKAILQYCWDEKRAFFCDYNLANGACSDQLTLAALFPLFFKIAAPAQAAAVAHRIEKDFLKPGGLVTTLMNTGQQWDAPNGWAPLQWIGFVGLRQYGFHNLAKTIQKRWMQLNEKVFAAEGKMMEKYNVEDIHRKAGGGEYPNQDGFGWTNGVYLAMSKA